MRLYQILPLKGIVLWSPTKTAKPTPPKKQGRFSWKTRNSATCRDFVSLREPAISKVQLYEFACESLAASTEEAGVLPTWMSQEVSKWVINGYNLLVNRVYWGYNLLTIILLTSWDIPAQNSRSWNYTLAVVAIGILFIMKCARGLILVLFSVKQTSPEDQCIEYIEYLSTFIKKTNVGKYPINPMGSCLLR